MKNSKEARIVAIKIEVMMVNYRNLEMEAIDQLESIVSHQHPETIIMDTVVVQAIVTETVEKENSQVQNTMVGIKEVELLLIALIDLGLEVKIEDKLPLILVEEEMIRHVVMLTVKENAKIETKEIKKETEKEKGKRSAREKENAKNRGKKIAKKRRRKKERNNYKKKKKVQ